jgi:tetratricopeptide (TPR) repeat protein
MAEPQVKQQMWEVLLSSSRKFLDLANIRVTEKDYIEAVSILNEALGYMNPNTFEGAPTETLDLMWRLNIEAYLKLANILITLKRFEQAKPYLEQGIN